MNSNNDNALLLKQFGAPLTSIGVEAQLALGNMYIEQNKLADALALFESLIVQDPSQAKAFNSLGHVYFCSGHLEQALKAFHHAVALDPYLALAHQNLGYTYSDLEHYDDAVLAFQNAIRIEPGNARPYHGLGLVYAIIGDEAHAINILQLSIMLDPLYAGPRISLAVIYQRQGQGAEYRAQVQYLTPLMECQKNYTQARFAAVYGNVDEALNWLEKVIAQTPGYRWTVRHAIDFVAIRRHPRFLRLLGELDSSESS